MDKFRKFLLCMLVALFVVLGSACGSRVNPTETTLPPETTIAPTVETTAATEEPTIETQAVTEAPTEETTEPPTEPETEPETEPTEDEGLDYVLNTNSRKFHYPNCSSVDSMKDSNKAYFHGTREEVIAKGYDPCGRCHP